MSPPVADLEPEKVILLGGPWDGRILIRPSTGIRIHTVGLLSPIAATYRVTQDRDEHGHRIARYEEQSGWEELS